MERTSLYGGLPAPPGGRGGRTGARSGIVWRPCRRASWSFDAALPGLGLT